MDLNAVKTLTEHKMWEHGLTAQGWTFAWGRGKQTFGTCRYRDKQIRISKHLASINDRERVLLTVLHEIAHALVGPGHAHNYVWKRKCIEIGGNGRARYGEDNTNCIKREEKDRCVVNGTVYSKGDHIRLSTSRGVTTGVFERYMPRNHKYPIIAKVWGKTYKFAKRSVLS